MCNCGAVAVPKWEWKPVVIEGKQLEVGWIVVEWKAYQIVCCLANEAKKKKQDWLLESCIEGLDWMWESVGHGYC